MKILFITTIDQLRAGYISKLMEADLVIKLSEVGAKPFIVKNRFGQDGVTIELNEIFEFQKSRVTENSTTTEIGI